ncbi:MAG: TonB-dependent receptor [Cytophagales bacterium]|nr:TonB-dependent receptor [Cytophagales bacterium]
MENYYFFSKVAIQVMRISTVSLVLTVWMTFSLFGKDIHGQDILDKKISLTVEQVTLKAVLSKIERQAEVSFVYSEDFVELSHHVSIQTRGEPLKNVLISLLRPHKINAHLHKHQIILSRRIDPPPAKKAGKIGAITGRVIEATTKQPLPGASVYVKGTTIGAATDLQGEFIILNVPAGRQTIVATYIGYAESEQAVNVESKSMVEVNFSLSPDVQSLAVVVVTGSLEGQTRALNQQKAADNIKNIISADLIGRFPDLNTAEALQRVPGINIGRDNGEGSSVQIRGTPLNYTSIQVNGEQLPGNGVGGDRSPSLTMYPIDQLGSIEVTKSLTPDQDGDAIGGVVNMLPPTATRLTPSVKLEAGSGYNNLSKGVNGIGRVSLGQRFFPGDKVSQGRLGVLLSGSFFRTDNGEDRTESEWEELTYSADGEERTELALAEHDLRALVTQRTRAGAGVNLDYKLDQASSIRFNFMYSILEEDEERFRTRFRMNSGSDRTPTFSRDAQVRKTFRDRVVQRDNFNYNLQGNFVLGNLSLEAAGFYTTTERDENAALADFRNREIDLGLSDLTSDFPQITSVDPILRLDDATIYNEWNEYQTYSRVNSNENIVGRLHLSHPFKLGTNTGLIKTGYKHRVTNSERSRVTQAYEYQQDSDGLYASFADYGAIRTDFLDDNVTFGPAINTSAVNSFFNDNQSDFARDPEEEANQDEPFFYDASETTNAAYLMGKLQIKDKLMILAGVRYEDISVEYSAIETIQDNDTLTRRPVTDGTDYDFWLPNLQFKYSLSKFTNIRAAVTRSFARPNFGDIVPTTNINIENERVIRGNPDLLPPIAWNYDLMFEHYLGNVGILSINGFYKRIENFQFNSRTQVEGATLFPDLGIPPGVIYRVDEPLNGDEAEVWGLELNVQANLDFLPGILKGINLFLNYTYTSSDAFTRDRTGIRLPGQADHTGNAAITFDYKGFSAKASLNYQDDLIEDLGADASTDILRESRYQLDLNASQQLDDRFRIYAEFINVTNQPQLQYLGSRDRIFDVGFFSWWSRFGVSYRL